MFVNISASLVTHSWGSVGEEVRRISNYIYIYIYISAIIKVHGVGNVGRVEWGNAVLFSSVIHRLNLCACEHGKGWW